jgi:predicted chitinase
MLLTAQILHDVMPRSPTNLIEAMVGALVEAKIDTRERIAALLGQVAHESNELQNWEELPNPKTGNVPAGVLYEGRTDLGNLNPGDGIKYKGRGPLQLTGKARYYAASRALGIDLVANPTLVAEPKIGLRVMGWTWNSSYLNHLSDFDAQHAFDCITYRINGGFNGRAQRNWYWRKARAALGLPPLGADSDAS